MKRRYSSFMSVVGGSMAAFVILFIAASFGFAQTENIPQGSLPTMPDAPDRTLPSLMRQTPSVPVGTEPKIERILPSSGPAGQYVTIEGERFGTTVGSVVFVNGAVSAEANLVFPDECKGLTWYERSIIIKVPQGLSDGAHTIKVKRLDGSFSNGVRFVVNQGYPTPGICALVPNNGPPGISVKIMGSRFGTTAGSAVMGSVDLAVEESGWSDSLVRVQTSLSESLSGKIRVITADKTLSNPVSFAFQRCSPGSCGVGASCCADGSCRGEGKCEDRPPICTYSWSFYTGELGGIGSPCQADVQCLSGVCIAGKCAPGQKGEGARCTFDAECKAGLKCENGICKSLLKKNGASCASSKECFSGKCEKGACVNGDKKLGEQCKNNQECASGNCYNGKCAQSLVCPKVLKTEPPPSAVYPQSIFSILFNQLMDESSLRSSLSFTPKTDGVMTVKTSGSGNEAKSLAEFRPTKPLQSGVTYLMSVALTAKSASSDNTLARCTAAGGNHCAGKGAVCDTKGSLCAGGAVCSGDSSICRGIGTICTGKGSKCLEGATCKGTGSTCLDKGSSCTNDGSVCRVQATCSGQDAQCAQGGTICTGDGSICRDGAECKGKPPVVKEEACSNTGQVCSAQGGVCSNGAQCEGIISRCSGSNTLCSGNGSTCMNDSTCDGSNSTCSGVGTLCTGSESKCINGARCTGVDPVCEGKGSECIGDNARCSNGAVCNESPKDIDCGINNSCPSGYICNTGTNKCIKPPSCGPNGECPSGLKCDPSSNSCRPTCGPNGECPGGLVCNPASNICIDPPSCNKDGKCPNGLKCNKENNKCYAPCGPGGSCPPGLSCNAASQTCEPPRECVNGTCPNGSVCSKLDNRCYPACGANGSCPGGLVCNPATNGCEPKVPCGPGGACPAGAVCNAETKMCDPIVYCDSLGNCPAGSACDTASGTCKKTTPPSGPRCGDGILQLDRGEECDGTISSCNSTSCTWIACGPKGECPGGSKCSLDGKCRPICARDSDCQSPLICDPVDKICKNPTQTVCALKKSCEPTDNCGLCEPLCTSAPRCKLPSAAIPDCAAKNLFSCQKADNTIECAKPCPSITTTPLCSDSAGCALNDDCLLCPKCKGALRCTQPPPDCKAQGKYECQNKDGTKFCSAMKCEETTATPPSGPRCGDGILQLDRGEECDDGSSNGTQGALCTSNCTRPACGPNGECPSGSKCSIDGKCHPTCQVDKDCAAPLICDPVEKICKSPVTTVCSEKKECKADDDCTLCEPLCTAAPRCKNPDLTKSVTCVNLNLFTCQKADGSLFCDKPCPTSSTGGGPSTAVCTAEKECATADDCGICLKCKNDDRCKTPPPDCKAQNKYECQNKDGGKFCSDKKCEELGDGALPPPCGDGWTLCGDKWCYKGSTCPTPPGPAPCDGDEKCEDDEGCSCGDCWSKQDSCSENLICRPKAGMCTPEKCGNKQVDYGEECDDGNLITGDGCSLNCKKEGSIDNSIACNSDGTCPAGFKKDPLSSECRCLKICTSDSDCPASHKCDKESGVCRASCPPDSNCKPNEQCRENMCKPRSSGPGDSSTVTAPNELKAEKKGTSQIDLSWQDTTSVERGFLIYRSKGDDQHFQPVAYAPADQTTLSDLNLESNTTYHYHVSAFNESAFSLFSNSAFAKTDLFGCLIFCATPAVPSMQVQASGTLARLTWTQSGENVTAFVIERSSDSGETKTYIQRYSVTAAERTFDDNDVVAGVIYWYRMYAVNGNKRSALTEAKSVVITGTQSVPKPGKPNLVAIPAGAEQIKLTWTNVENETGYKVYRTSNTPGFFYLTTLGKDAVQHTDTNLGWGNPYTYIVVAVNEQSGETASDQVSARTHAFGCLLFCKDPKIPTNFDAQALAGTIQLTWQHDGADLTAFRIERSSSMGTEKIFDWNYTVGKDQRSYSDSQVSPGTTYWYRVRALNDTRESLPSALDSAGLPAVGGGGAIDPPLNPGGGGKYQNKPYWVDSKIHYFDWGALWVRSTNAIAKQRYPDNLVGQQNKPGRHCLDILNKRSSPASGFYWINPDGGLAINVYCDMTTDGGGWTLVLLNSTYPTPPAPTWNEAINANNIQGKLSDGIESGFDQFLGVKYWNLIGTRMRIEVGSNSQTLNHRAYVTFSLDASRNYKLSMSDITSSINSGGPSIPGIYDYHAARGYVLSTFDKDNDAYGAGNCATFYGNTPWWYGECWSGSFWGGGGSKGQSVYVPENPSGPMCSPTLRIGLIGFYNKSHPTYDWLLNNHLGIIGAVDTESDVNTLLSRDYDIYMVDAAWWGAQGYNETVEKLWKAGKNIISIGNDTSQQLYPIKKVGWHTNAAAPINLSSETVAGHPVVAEYHPMLQVGTSFDSGASYILEKQPEFTPLYVRTEQKSNITGLIGEREGGGVWFHDNTNGLTFTSQGRTVLLSVLDYMTRNNAKRAGSLERFEDSLRKAPDSACVPLCNNNGVCDSNEGCNCSDCDAQRDSCTAPALCSFSQKKCAIGPVVTPCIPQIIPGKGLRGQYFATEHKDPPSQIPQGSVLIDRIDPTINFDWTRVPNDSSVPPGWFLVRWTGGIRVPTNGTYQFHTRSDDGIVVTIDNKTIINNWTPHGTISDRGSVTLEKDKLYPITITYYENMGYGWMQLFWSASGLAEQIVPVEYLYPSSTDTISTCAAGGSGIAYLDSFSVLVDGSDRTSSLTDSFSCVSGKSCPVGATATHTYSVKTYGKDSAGVIKEITSPSISWSFPQAASSLVSMTVPSGATTQNRTITALTNGTQVIHITVQDTDEKGFIKRLEKDVVVTVSSLDGTGGGGGGTSSKSGSLMLESINILIDGVDSGAVSTLAEPKKKAGSDNFYCSSVLGNCPDGQSTKHIYNAEVMGKDDTGAIVQINPDLIEWNINSGTPTAFSKTPVTFNTDEGTTAIDQMQQSIESVGSTVGLTSTLTATAKIRSNFAPQALTLGLSDGWCGSKESSWSRCEYEFDGKGRRDTTTTYTWELVTDQQSPNNRIEPMGRLSRTGGSGVTGGGEYRVHLHKESHGLESVLGKTFTFSVWVKTGSATSLDLALGTDRDQRSQRCLVGNAWTRCVLTITTSTDASKYPRPDELRAYIYLQPDIKYLVYGAQIERGSSPTVMGMYQLSADVTLSFCRNPWSYSDSTDDFKLFYCRDSGTSVLPPLASTPRIRDTNSGLQSTIFNKELIFPFVKEGTGNVQDPNYTDVIIVRSALNPNRLPLAEWYRNSVPLGTMTERASIDGFQTIQDSSGIYVMAPDFTPDSNSSVPHVLFFATSTGMLDAVTTQVFERLLSWAQLSASRMGSADGDALRRDITRYTRFYEIRKSLERYGKSFTKVCPDNPLEFCPYPNLSSGSYIQYQTTSLWPSWRQSLSTLLGTALPLDPLQEQAPPEIQCTAPHDKDTCWSESTKSFAFETSSETGVLSTLKAGKHVYTYRTLDNGKDYTLCTQFEKYLVIKTLFGLNSDASWQNTTAGAASIYCVGKDPSLSLFDRGKQFLNKLALYVMYPFSTAKAP